MEQKISELEDAEPELPDYIEVHQISGLDTLYIGLLDGNIALRCRVDTFLERLKTHYNATTA